MTYRQPFRGEYPITQPYGGTDTSAFHTGIDYACPLNTRILASGGGTVVFCGWDSTGYGNCVILQHKDGKATLYAHLASFPVGQGIGQRIAQGEVIGFSGSTGNSTGHHLHFEARRVWNDYTTHENPVTFLPMMSVDDVKPPKPALKGADALGPDVEVVAPLGVWAWSPDFTKRQTVYPCGTKLHYTGRTTTYNGLTYCECYPEPAKYWVAVNDGDCQILDNSG
jgi:hypothetical protein